MLMAVTKKSPTPLLLAYILKPNRFQKHTKNYSMAKWK